MRKQALYPVDEHPEYDDAHEYIEEMAISTKKGMFPQERDGGQEYPFSITSRPATWATAFSRKP